MNQRRFDVATCLRHLAAHKRAFQIEDSSALTHFTALVGEAESSTIECSCKIEGDRVHPARFNHWVQEQASEKQMAAALRFFARVESDERCALDHSLFRQFCGNDFDWSKTDSFVVGVDLRATKSDSRLKIWFKLGEYPAKEREAFLLSSASAELQALVVRTGFLVGFDFHLDGRSAIKLYPRIEKTDLEHPATRARLANVLSAPALALLGSCPWAYVSLALDGGGRLLQCRPADPTSFLAKVVRNDRATEIAQRCGHEDLLETVVSLRERELLASNIENLTVYFTFGALTAAEGRSPLGL